MPLRYVYDIFGNIAFTEDITKHSPNIIDVIEVGDYVNGYKVSFIDKDYKWIVRTKYGHLEVCKDKPEKEYVIWTRHHGYFNIGAFNHLFPFITWNDEEPYNIEELLKGE